MIEAILRYHKAEKTYSIYYMVLGLFSIILSVIFLVKQQPFYNGVSYVLMSIGLIQLVSGTSLLLRSDINIEIADYVTEKDLEIVKDKEISRMYLLIKNLEAYCKAGIICIFLGILFWSYNNPLTIGKGLGIGLTIQSLILLLLDYLATQRGKVYLIFLNS